MSFGWILFWIHSLHGARIESRSNRVNLRLRGSETKWNPSWSFHVINRLVDQGWTVSTFTPSDNILLFILWSSFMDLKKHYKDVNRLFTELPTVFLTSTLQRVPVLKTKRTSENILWNVGIEQDLKDVQLRGFHLNEYHLKNLSTDSKIYTDRFSGIDSCNTRINLAQLLELWAFQWAKPFVQSGLVSSSKTSLYYQTLLLAALTSQKHRSNIVRPNDRTLWFVLLYLVLAITSAAGTC